MLDLKSGVVLALALAGLSTASTAAAAPTASASKWIYWTSPTLAPSSSGSYADCASAQVTRIQDHFGSDSTYFLYRAPYSSICVDHLERSAVAGRTAVVDGGFEEVVLFKPEALLPGQDALEANAMSWSERAVQAHMLRASHDQSDDGGREDEREDEGDQLAFSFRSPVSTSASSSQSVPRLLTATNNTLVLTLTAESLATIDQSATYDTRIQRLTFRPVSTLSATSLQEEKPLKSEPKFKKPKYNSNIARIASSSALNPERIRKDLRILTGEGEQPKEIGKWHTRHSSTAGARLAGKWIKQQLEESLEPLTGSKCEFWEYSPYFAPNVVCKVPASGKGHQGEGEVIVSAHYDSRGTFGSTTAPGGDDDGSGTSALLAIARTIGSSQLNFSSPIQLIAFSGEEQGLVGSQRYATHLSETHQPIKLAIQMDMLAYHVPGEPLQIAFPDKLSTTTATAHIWSIADIYAPELEQGYTPACCSDHQSFWENGFPATWVFERNGPIADPMYHNSGDTTNRTGYDINQLASIAKVVTASLLDVAGFEL